MKTASFCNYTYRYIIFLARYYVLFSYRSV
jgi:hypothetical protein